MTKNRSELLDQMIEKGKREKAIVLPFPQQEEDRQIGSFVVEAVLPATLAVMGVTASVAVIGMVFKGSGVLEASEPEPVPHDLWSFLGSRSGRAVINGAFKTVQVLIDR